MQERKAITGKCCHLFPYKAFLRHRRSLQAAVQTYFYNCVLNCYTFVQHLHQILRHLQFCHLIHFKIMLWNCFMFKSFAPSCKCCSLIAQAINILGGGFIINSSLLCSSCSGGTIFAISRALVVHRRQPDGIGLSPGLSPVWGGKLRSCETLQIVTMLWLQLFFCYRFQAIICAWREMQ